MDFEILGPMREVHTIAITGSKKRFVICVRNTGYDASLDRRKVYEALPDRDAEKEGLVRVIDESGEDYLYPSAYFIAVDLPQAVQDALIGAS